GGGQCSADLEQASDAPFGSQPVTEEAAGGHSRHKGSQAQACECFWGENDALKVNVAPIEHGAFADHGAKGNDPQVDQGAVGSGEDRSVLFRSGVDGDQVAGNRDDDNIGQC